MNSFWEGSSLEWKVIDILEGNVTRPTSRKSDEWLEWPQKKCRFFFRTTDLRWNISESSKGSRQVLNRSGSAGYSFFFKFLYLQSHANPPLVQKIFLLELFVTTQLGRLRRHWPRDPLSREQRKRLQWILFKLIKSSVMPFTLIGNVFQGFGDVFLQFQCNDVGHAHCKESASTPIMLYTI